MVVSVGMGWVDARWGVSNRWTKEKREEMGEEREKKGEKIKSKEKSRSHKPCERPHLTVI